MKTQTLILTASLLLASAFVMAQNAEVQKTEVRKIRTIEVNANGETVMDTTITFDNDEFWGFRRSQGMHGNAGRRGMGRFDGTQGEGFRQLDNNNAEWAVAENADGEPVKVLKFTSPCGISREIEMDANFVPGQGRMMASNGRMNTGQRNATRRINNNRNSLFNAQNGMKSNRNFRNGLNHDDIISYEKETLKNGTEKITIIRKK